MLFRMHQCVNDRSVATLWCCSIKNTELVAPTMDGPEASDLERRLRELRGDAWGRGEAWRMSQPLIICPLGILLV
jgi:hypothetical protein